MTKTSDTSWFAVSREGLRRQAKERGAAVVLLELVSNVMDEAKAGATRCDIKIARPKGKRFVLVEVTDNAPKGWADIGDAWTLFAESYKRNSTKLRGQFNIGEKFFLALCRMCTIISTQGGVAFDDSGRRRLRRKTEVGTEIHAEFEMSTTEQIEFEALLRMVVCPELTITYNSRNIPQRERIASTNVFLQTKVANAEGVMESRWEFADVEAYEPIDGENPMLFEMGIPVVEIDCRWHLNVCQRLPLNHDRDNVTPYYRRQILTAAAEMAVEHDLLNRDDAAGWCTEVLEHTDNPETIQAIVTQRFGEKRVIADPNDREATTKAGTKGYTVIHGGSLTAEAWERVKKHADVKPAGQLFASPKPFSGDPDAKPVEWLKESELTSAMKKFRARARRFATKAFAPTNGFDLDVRFTKDRLPDVQALWRKTGDLHARLIMNTPALDGGKAWFEGDESRQNDLLVHELAHQICGPHHDCHKGRYFYDAVSKVAGRLLSPASQTVYTANEGVKA